MSPQVAFTLAVSALGLSAVTSLFWAMQWLRRPHAKVISLCYWASAGVSIYASIRFLLASWGTPQIWNGWVQITWSPVMALMVLIAVNAVARTLELSREQRLTREFEQLRNGLEIETPAL